MTQGEEIMLQNLIAALVDQLEMAQKCAESGEAFNLGRKMGLWEALNMLINRAKSFGVSELGPIDLRKYL